MLLFVRVLRFIGFLEWKSVVPPDEQNRLRYEDPCTKFYWKGLVNLNSKKPITKSAFVNGSYQV